MSEIGEWASGLMPDDDNCPLKMNEITYRQWMVGMVASNSEAIANLNEKDSASCIVSLADAIIAEEARTRKGQ